MERGIDARLQEDGNTELCRYVWRVPQARCAQQQRSPVFHVGTGHGGYYLRWSWDQEKDTAGVYLLTADAKQLPLGWMRLLEFRLTAIACNNGAGALTTQAQTGCVLDAQHDGLGWDTFLTYVSNSRFVAADGSVVLHVRARHMEEDAFKRRIYAVTAYEAHIIHVHGTGVCGHPYAVQMRLGDELHMCAATWLLRRTGRLVSGTGCIVWYIVVGCQARQVLCPWALYQTVPGDVELHACELQRADVECMHDGGHAVQIVALHSVTREGKALLQGSPYFLVLSRLVTPGGVLARMSVAEGCTYDMARYVLYLVKLHDGDHRVTAFEPHNVVGIGDAHNNVQFALGVLERAKMPEPMPVPAPQPQPQPQLASGSDAVDTTARAAKKAKSDSNDAGSSSSLPPAYLMCSLTLDVLDNPYTSKLSGISYSYAPLRQWVDQHHTEPNTQQHVDMSDFVRNLALTDATEQWRRDHPQQP